MTERIRGGRRHPGRTGSGRLCHALAGAYAEGSRAGGHHVEMIRVADIDVPFLGRRIR